MQTPGTYVNQNVKWSNCVKFEGPTLKMASGMLKMRKWVTGSLCSYLMSCVLVFNNIHRYVPIYLVSKIKWFWKIFLSYCLHSWWTDKRKDGKDGRTSPYRCTSCLKTEVSYVSSFIAYTLNQLSVGCAGILYLIHVPWTYLYIDAFVLEFQSPNLVVFGKVILWYCLLW